MAHATVSRCLTRRGLLTRAAAEREEVRRFEWPCPGDLLQMDTKRLARFTRPGHAGDRRPLPQRRREARAGRLGVLPLDHRRPLPPGLHRAARRREGRHRHRLRRAGARRSSPTTASPRGGCRPTTPGSTSTTAACASCWPEHGIQHRRIPPRTPSATGRSSATSRPGARMGLRAALPLKRRSSRSAAQLARPLQHHQAPQRDRQPAADQPRSEGPGQNVDGRAEAPRARRAQGDEERVDHGRVELRARAATTAEIAARAGQVAASSRCARARSPAMWPRPAGPEPAQPRRCASKKRRIRSQASSADGPW